MPSDNPVQTLVNALERIAADDDDPHARSCCCDVTSCIAARALEAWRVRKPAAQDRALFSAVYGVVLDSWSGVDDSTFAARMKVRMDCVEEILKRVDEWLAAPGVRGEGG